MSDRVEEIMYFALVVYELDNNLDRTISIEYVSFNSNEDVEKYMNKYISSKNGMVQVTAVVIDKNTFNKETYKYIPRMFIINNKILSASDIIHGLYALSGDVNIPISDEAIKEYLGTNTDSNISMVSVDCMSESMIKIIKDYYNLKDDTNISKASITGFNDGDVITLPYHPNYNDILCQHGTYV